jgi:hypothetical protein
MLKGLNPFQPRARLTLMLTLFLVGCANPMTTELIIAPEAVNTIYVVPTGQMKLVNQGGAANFGAIAISAKSSKEKLKAFVGQVEREEADKAMAEVIIQSLSKRYGATYELMPLTLSEIALTDWYNDEVRDDFPADWDKSPGNYVVDFGPWQLKYFYSPFVADTVTLSAGIRVIELPSGKVIARKLYDNPLKTTSLPSGFNDMDEAAQIKAARQTLLEEYRRAATELVEGLLP